VDESDRKGTEFRATAVGMRVLFAQAQESLAPADDQPDCESGDDERDRGLGRLLHMLRQVPVEQHDGHAESEEGDGVPDAPRRAETSSSSCCVSSRAGDERRDSGNVIRVGCMPKAKQDGYDHDEPHGGAV
jgi:hypothetical protein